MIIASKNLISELKNFVATGPTFKAKPGETDDLVMATLLVIRMILVMKEYDANLDDIVRDSHEDLLPMPFIVF
jgi:hypothetical protein